MLKPNPTELFWHKRHSLPLPRKIPAEMAGKPAEVPVPKKSQTRFYSFLMYKAIPTLLKRFRKMDGQEKYFWDKEGMHMWYSYRIRVYWEAHDYIMVAICALIAYYLKEKKDDFQNNRRQD